MQHKYFRLIIAPLCLLYFVLSVFLGGWPLNRTLAPHLFDGRIALVLLILCIVYSYNLIPKWSPSRCLEYVFCAALVALAAYLRLNGLDNIIRNGPSVDEVLIIPPVLNMLQRGTLNFHQYQYGGVFYYILLAVFTFYVSRTAFRFEYSDFRSIPEQNFYQAGRISAGIFSILTVFLTYFTARKFFGLMAAIVASILMALCYLDYNLAHQVRLDLALTFFVIAAHYFLLEMLQKPAALYYFFAGIFCGLSIGTKFTVAPIFVSLIVTHLLATKGKKWLDWNIVIASLTAIGVFFLFNLASFQHLNEFLQLLTVAVQHNLSPEQRTHSANRPLEYFGILVTQGIGYIALIPLFLTLALLLYRRDERLIVMWCFPALFLIHLGLYPSGFPRYVLPVIPNLAILAGFGAQEIYSWLVARWQIQNRRKLAIGLILVVLITILPLIDAGNFIRDMKNRLDPAEVVSWVEKNIPENSSILVDPTGPLLPENKYDIREIVYRDFRRKDFADADYLCVTEDLFDRIPKNFTVIKEFPAKTQSLDRTVRIYKPKE